jgi:hypothetical protein
MRARNLKPGFFKNEELAALGPYAQILFAGLWGLADREGKLEDRPARIKVEIFPYYDPKPNVMTLLDKLMTSHFIQRYVINGHHYIKILTFPDHQNPHPHEVASKIPEPEITNNNDVMASHDKSLHDTTCNGNVMLNPSSLNPSSLNPSSNGRFDMFWKEYPIKKSKPDAEKAFNKLNPDDSLLKKILSAIERAKKSQDWLKDNGQYIPFPATWLNGRRWEDELKIEHKTESDYPSCEKVMRDQGFSKEDLDRP